MAHTEPGNPHFWLGSYTPEHGRSGAGISLLGQEDAGTLRPLSSTLVDSPSFVATHPVLPVIYAALETSGYVEAFSVGEGGSLRALGQPVEAGDSVCHLTVTPDGAALIASCYGDGQVLVYALGANGSFASAATAGATSADPYGNPLAGQIGLPGESGFGENALAELVLQDAIAEASVDRQSRAHASLVLPDGRVATTDLGHDSVRIWRRTTQGLSAQHEVVLPFGVGPRHLVAHPSGHVHVVTEYSTEVFTLAEGDDGLWRVAGSVLATADPAESGDAASEISIAHSQDQLHVSIRGTNRVSTIAVRGDGSELRAIADVESGGDWPRHHVESGGILHVANQRSNEIGSFALDGRGIPSRLIGVVDAGTPSCLVRV